MGFSYLWGTLNRFRVNQSQYMTNFIPCTFLHDALHVICRSKNKSKIQDTHYPIRCRSDYIIGFITPAIGPNKSEKLTRPIVPTHNLHGKVWMADSTHGLQRINLLSVHEAMYVVFHSNFALYIVYRRYKPCEFLEFVWTDCWDNKSNYVITSPAN